MQGHVVRVVVVVVASVAVRRRGAVLTAVFARGGVGHVVHVVVVDDVAREALLLQHGPAELRARRAGRVQHVGERHDADVDEGEAALRAWQDREHDGAAAPGRRWGECIACSLEWFGLGEQIQVGALVCLG